MNILHLKYAVEVAKTRSINKAAENLYMGQPNLSRAIKELEESIGIELFKRTSKGMSVTPQGEAFVSKAQKLLLDIHQMESMYQEHDKKGQRFSVSVPRAAYLADAFVAFAKQIDQNLSAEISYKETNAIRAISNILQCDYHLGIIRYQQIFDQKFRTMLKEKGLESQLITEFKHVLLIAKSNPLATKDKIVYGDLKTYIEIAHADPFVPSLPVHEVQKEEYMEEVNKRIFVFERASQMELLQKVPNTFMWVSPGPKSDLTKYNLVEKECNSDSRTYKDVLIYRKDYQFSPLDHLFMTEVMAAKRKYIGQ